jgi:fructosamine-3-kinase
MLHPGLLQHLSSHCGWQLQAQHLLPLGGGSINEVFRISGAHKHSFVVKVNSATKFPQLFAREATGLLALAPFVQTPAVLAQGEVDGFQYLLMEWITEETPTAAFWKQFGTAMAALHTVQAPSFGSFENNYMGAVPQDNRDARDWSVFFAQRRLMPLADKCAEKGLLDKKDCSMIEQVCKILPHIFSSEPPALLHGDLWSGNFLCSSGARPVLIDPAVYYGHPSVDMGMTTLFGGFDTLFYEAYHYHKPLPPKYKEEWELCNLYPLLIHLLLFGSGYLGSIRQTLQRFAGTQHRIV